MSLTRKKILNSIKDLVFDTDVVFCIGPTLCKESSGFTESTVFLDNNFVDFFSVVIGVAMSTNKRILVVVEDQYLLRYFNSMLQMAVSKCTNLFVIVVVTSLYEPSIRQVNLFNALRSVKGLLFNSGVLTHEYTNYFETKASIKQLKSIYYHTLGPVVGLVVASSNRVYNTNFDSIITRDLKSISEFIKNKEVGISIPESKRKVSDLDKIMKDK
jgi:hypothetical protein